MTHWQVRYQCENANGGARKRAGRVPRFERRRTGSGPGGTPVTPPPSPQQGRQPRGWDALPQGGTLMRDVTTFARRVGVRLGRTGGDGAGDRGPWLPGAFSCAASASPPTEREPLPAPRGSRAGTKGQFLTAARTVSQH